MLYLLFFQRIGRQHDYSYTEWLHTAVNFVPFRTIAEFAHMVKISDFSIGYLGDFAIKNLGGNVILFIPLGIFLPTLFQRQKKFLICVGTIIALIILVELIQLFTMLGSCDIDDLLLNVCGAAMGFAIWKLTTYFRQKHYHK